MTHAFAPDARQCDFNAAPVADHALVLDALVFSARTFPVPGRPENTFAEKAALLRFERAVINCLRVFDFAFAPGAHGIAGGNANCDLIKTHRPLFAHYLTPGMFVHVFSKTGCECKITRRSP